MNLGFSGFVASESYQKQSNRHKYSFTMVDGGNTRARNVSASLMKDSATLASLDLNNVDTDEDTINHCRRGILEGKQFLGGIRLFGHIKPDPDRRLQRSVVARIACGHEGRVRAALRAYGDQGPRERSSKSFYGPFLLRSAESQRALDPQKIQTTRRLWLVVSILTSSLGRTRR